MNKHIIWATTIFLIVLMLCGTLIWLNYNSWTLRLEMDENMKDAIESIEWEEIKNQKQPYENKHLSFWFMNGYETPRMTYNYFYENAVELEGNLSEENICSLLQHQTDNTLNLLFACIDEFNETTFYYIKYDMEGQLFLRQKKLLENPLKIIIQNENQSNIY